jgi:hypothetical protein
MRKLDCLLAALLGCVVAALAPASALAASAAVDQASQLGDSDPLAALAILQQADEAGDAEASAVLANTLFFAPPPRTNRARACAIAQRLADGGRGDGWALLASCQLVGTLPAADRLEAARASARRAIALGSAQGGVALFTAYVADPRFAMQDSDKASAPPAPLRSVQAEAWTGLSLALDQGSAMAAEFALAALATTAAPGNLQRVVDIAERAPAAARRFAEAVALARQFQALGGTHASPQVIPRVQRAALSAATLGLWRDGGSGCDSLNLDRTEPRAPEAEAAYLPVRLGPLAGAYLISGRWQERWTFSGCGREVPVDIAFAADGAGGADFEAAVAPRSIVRRTP